jgi:hypothetical protein
MGGLEIIGGLAVLFGALLCLVGWIWLIVLGFKTGGALWGILNIFCQPITGIIFCIMHKIGWLPLALMIIGMVIEGIGMVPLLPAYIKMLEQMK